MKIRCFPFALSLSEGHLWFDKPVLSKTEGLTMNGAITSLSLTRWWATAHERLFCFIVPSPVAVRISGLVGDAMPPVFGYPILYQVFE